MKLVLMMIAAVATGSGVASQDAVKLLPNNYKVQFENEWVRVTAVRYGPLEKLPEHTHTALPSAYVYLSDSGPIVFRHVGGPSATRQPVKAGTFRVYRGITETHEVENTASFASEFLRVELKTAGRDAAAIRGKFERSPVTATPTVHFDHPQFRVTRVWVQPGQTVELKADAQPMLVIAMSAEGTVKTGQTSWVTAGRSTQLGNAGRAPIDFLQMDFKTSPPRS